MTVDEAAREYAEKVVPSEFPIDPLQHILDGRDGLRAVYFTAFAAGAAWALAEAAKIAEAEWVADWDDHAEEHSKYTARHIAATIRTRSTPAAGEGR